MARPRRTQASKEVTTQEVIAAPEVQSPGMKTVHNRNKYKVELVVEGKVVVLLSGKSAQVPVGYKVPENMGLYVKR